MGQFKGQFPIDSSTIKILVIEFIDKELKIGDCWLEGNISSQLTASITFDDDTIFASNIVIEEGVVKKGYKEILNRLNVYPYLTVNQSMYLTIDRPLINGEVLAIAGFTLPEKEKENISTSFSGNFQKPGTIIQGFFEVSVNAGIVEEVREGTNITDYYYIPTGKSIGNSNSNAEAANDYLKELYLFFWQASNRLPEYTMVVKGNSPLEDWDAERVINLPSFEGRTLTHVSQLSEIGKLIGAAQMTLTLANLFPHNHGGGNHKPTGKVDTYHGHNITSGHGLSYNANTPYRNVTEFSNDTRNYSTAAAGNLNQPLVMNWTGNIITTQGSGLPFSLKEKSVQTQMLIYLGCQEDG